MQQELLVILRSSFANGEIIERTEENRKLSPEEKLEEAFTNGSIQDFFPEVFKNGENKVYLWEVHPGFSFLQLELGEAPLNIDVRFSIDPHNFFKYKMLQLIS